MSYIEIRNLTKKFGKNTVLDHVNLDIEKGQVVALIGPSGTGKSTLLRCINLLEKPESGSVVLNGEQYNLTTKSARTKVELRRRTEMVFQQFNLFKQKDVLHNVMEGLTVIKKMDRKTAETIAKNELEKVGMSNHLYHFPRHLSGGQQQRVAIARALVLKPELLLMDEPTSALDPELVSEVNQTVKKVAAEGNTILLVTHDMNFVRSVADRVIFLENGKVVADDTAKEIFNNPKNERLKTFLLNINAINGMEYMI